MFIRTIMVMNEQELTHIFFCERARQYFLNPDIGRANGCNRQVFDLINVIIVFNLYDDIKYMVERDLTYTKSTWKKIVWSRGWILEDTFWRIEKQLHQRLDLLGNVNHGVRYLTWRKIADKYPELTRKCEILSKILCHSSILKNDDLRLKSQTCIYRLCNLCDQHAAENAQHFIQHCAYFSNLIETRCLMRFLMFMKVI